MSRPMSNRSLAFLVTAFAICIALVGVAAAAPGDVTLTTVSPAAWERCARTTTPRVYFDWTKLVEAREWLGLRGIEEGAVADVVVYAADPRSDLTTLQSPQRTVLRGRVVA